MVDVSPDGSRHVKTRRAKTRSSNWTTAHRDAEVSTQVGVRASFQRIKLKRGDR
jgi:hypothetical protein